MNWLKRIFHNDHDELCTPDFEAKAAAAQQEPLATIVVPDNHVTIMLTMIDDCRRAYPANQMLCYQMLCYQLASYIERHFGVPRSQLDHVRAGEWDRPTIFYREEKSLHDEYNEMMEVLGGQQP